VFKTALPSILSTFPTISANPHGREHISRRIHSGRSARPLSAHVEHAAAFGDDDDRTRAHHGTGRCYRVPVECKVHHRRGQISDDVEVHKQKLAIAKTPPASW